MRCEAANYILKNNIVDNKFLECESFSEAIPQINTEKSVVSIVGGGGKTSLMFAIADEMASLRKKVIVTTSTHIASPIGYITVETLAQGIKQLEKEKIIVVGEHVTKRKLQCAPDFSVKEALKYADIILIEADGAKMLPFKVPIDKEPVIFKETTLTLGVLGIDAYEKPIKEKGFRIQQLCEVLGVNEKHLINACDYAQVFADKNGQQKNIPQGCHFTAILNKADNEQDIKKCKLIADKLRDSANVHRIIDQLLITSFKRKSEDMSDVN